jgi:hypothetical protein
MRWYNINTFLEDRYFIPFDTPRIIWNSFSTTSSPTRSLFLNSQSLRLPSSQYSNIMYGPTNVKNNLKNIIGSHCIINWNHKHVCFVDRWLSFCTFSFGHCDVCSYSIYGFWLPVRYLQTLLWTPFVFYRKKRDCQFACSSVNNRLLDINIHWLNVIWRHLL